jgi:hypothetical protein
MAFPYRLIRSAPRYVVDEESEATGYVRASYTALCRLFGDSGDAHYERGNLNTAWLLEDASGRIYFVHDSADDGPVDETRALARYEWHVHAPERTALDALCAELEQHAK